MANTFAVSLGSGVDLTKGLRPVWNAADPEQWPFFKAKQSPVRATDLDPAQLGTEWNQIEITLHDTVEDLAGALQPLEVKPAHSDPTPGQLPLGRLALGDADREAALKSLAAHLGLDLTEAGLGFALVRWRRANPSVAYPKFEADGRIGKDDAYSALTETARTELSKLRPGPRNDNPEIERSPTPEHARRALNAFHEFGTHVISHVTLGDEIFQVFSYRSSAWQQIRDEYRDQPLNTREDARGFKYYTQKRGSDDIGFVHQVGTPHIRSGDPKFADARSNQKLNDATYAKADSILTLLENRDVLESLKSKQVPISFTLAPLSNLCVEPLLHAATVPVAALVRDIFMGVMLLKYDGREQLRFQRQASEPPSGLLRFGFDDLQSNIATSRIDLFLPSLTLDQIKLLNPEDVQTLNLFALALQVGTSDKVTLPGSEVALGSYYVSGRPDTQTQDALKPGVIELSDDAYNKLQCAFGWVDGAIMLRSTSGKERRVLVRGFSLVLNSTQLEAGRWQVSVAEEKSEHLTQSLFERFESSINLSLVVAEALLRAPARTSSQVAKRRLARSYLAWLSVALDKVDTAKLSGFANQVLYLTVSAEDPSPAMIVPPFIYQAYEPQVANIQKYAEALIGKLKNLQQQLREERNQAIALQQQQRIEEALKNQADKLNAFFEGTAAYHKDAGGALKQLIEKDSRALTQQLAVVETLRKEYEKKKLDANTELNTYIGEQLEEAHKEILMVVVEGVQALYEVGTVISEKGKGIGGAAKKVLDFAKSVQKLMALIEKLRTVAQKIDKAGGKTNLVADVKNFLLADTGDFTAQLPNSAQWSNFFIDVRQSLASLPGGKDKIVDAYEEMVNVGRGWAEAQVRAHDIAREIYANTLRQQVEERQAQRLSELTNTANANGNRAALQPKTAKVDLVGISGVLQLRIAQALASLAQVLEKQDEALVYETFKAPFQLQSFSLESLYAVIVEQSQQLTPDKLETFEKRDPITLTVDNVPLAQITNGNYFEHEFAIDKAYDRLHSYLYHVRLENYEVELEGLTVKSPTNGDQNYSLKVEYVGAPFYDRDRKGETQKFRTPSIVRAIEVNPVKHTNSKPEYLQPTYQGPRPIRVTPFSLWRVQLLDKLDELKAKNLEFAGNTVKLKYTFHLSAGDTRVAPRTGGRMLRTTALAEPAPDYSLATFLANLHGKEKSALMGWDVVFSLSEKKVNILLKQQWDSKQTALPPLPKITTTFPDVMDDDVVFDLNLTNVKLGPPKLQFSDSVDNKASLELALEGGGWELKKRGKDEPEEKGKTVKQGTIDKSGNITGSVELTLVHGEVTPDGGKASGKIGNVILDFTKGAFDSIVIKGLTLSGAVTKMIAAEARNALVEHFKKHNFSYSLGALDFTGHAGLIPGLTPHDFFLRTILKDKDHSYLQLFINTNARAANGGEPIYRNGRGDMKLGTSVPIPDGYDCCLMVNSMILFRDILGNGFSGAKLEAKSFDSSIVDKSELLWSARIKEWFSATETFDLGNNKIRIGDREGKGTTTIVVDNVAITRREDPAPFGGASFTGLNFNMPEKKWKIDFESYTYRPPIDMTDQGEFYWTHNYNDWVEAALSMKFNAALAISGEGSNQSVHLALGVSTSAINIGANARLPESCSSPADKLRQDMKTAIEKTLPDKIKDQINRTSFNSISVFALKNLLFPGSNFINLKAIHAPGDLVLLGEIKTSK